MKLPNYAEAAVPKEKIRDYLLSTSHPDGRSKAEFFLRYGFTREHWQEMAIALRRQAGEVEVARVEESSFGTRYVIEGIIHTPDGRTPGIVRYGSLSGGKSCPVS